MSSLIHRSSFVQMQDAYQLHAESAITDGVIKARTDCITDWLGAMEGDGANKRGGGGVHYTLTSNEDVRVRLGRSWTWQRAVGHQHGQQGRRCAVLYGYRRGDQCVRKETHQ